MKYSFTFLILIFCIIMVYIIQTAQYDKEHNLCEVIKIGYTQNWEKRLSTYECYCHHLIVLKIYENGTLEDETKLKKYFKDSIVYKDEWISCTENILKFFKENDTLEKLRESLKEINPIQPSKHIRRR